MSMWPGDASLKAALKPTIRSHCANFRRVSRPGKSPCRTCEEQCAHGALGARGAREGAGPDPGPADTPEGWGLNLRVTGSPWNVHQGNNMIFLM